MINSLITYTAKEANVLSKVNRNDYIECLIEDTLKEIDALIKYIIDAGCTSCIYRSFYEPFGLVMIPVKEILEDMGYNFEYIEKFDKDSRYKYKISWSFETKL